MKKVVFRVDASYQIGTGHIIRCLTLAKALKEKNTTCVFICRENSGDLCKRIEGEGFKVLKLQKAHNKIISDFSQTRLEHAEWLGVEQKVDAEETIQMISNSDSPDWLIVDHYGIDFEWEQRLRPHVNKIMVIDDIADRQHDCDLLLDQNFGSSKKRYEGLVPSQCIQFHGPSYALLSPSFSRLRKSISARDGRINRVLVYFGGGDDALEMIILTLEVFNSLDLKDIHLDIVIPKSFENHSSLKAALLKRGNAKIFSELPDLVELISQADLSIGAGGSTTWERCCLGLPSLVISMASNQLPSCLALARDGYIFFLGLQTEVKSHIIRDFLKTLLKSPQSLQNMSSHCLELVDGLGVSRIMGELSPRLTQ